MYALNKLVTVLTRNGQKQRSELMVFKTLKRLKILNRKAIRRLFLTIVKNCSSVLELLQPSSGRKKKKYPFFVSFTRNKRLTVHNISRAIKKRLNDKLSDRLLFELNDNLKNKGFAVKLKEQLYEFALENLALMHKIGKTLSKKRRKKISRF